MLDQKSFLRSALPWLASALVFLMVCTASELNAQDDKGAAPATTESSSDEAEPPPTLWSKIKTGGWAMWPLAVLSICMITLAVYNFMQLTKGKFAPPVLQQTVLANMTDVRVRSAIDASVADPSYLGRMLATSFPFVDATDPESLGRDKVEDAIADFAI